LGQDIIDSYVRVSGHKHDVKVFKLHYESKKRTPLTFLNNFSKSGGVSITSGTKNFYLIFTCCLA